MALLQMLIWSLGFILSFWKLETAAPPGLP